MGCKVPSKNISHLNNRQILQHFCISSLNSLVANLDSILIGRYIWSYNPMLSLFANGLMLLLMHINTSILLSLTACVRLVSSESIYTKTYVIT